ncbi:MAG: cyclic lactone autoinducer peptide [Clostridiales bacterium 43-6]|nr:MAG: cyclic lactone autoinducer peptide [Clostridiales bacterium 43-6]
MKKFYAVIAAVATVLATMFATSACFWFGNQPVEPASLRDE